MISRAWIKEAYFNWMSETVRGTKYSSGVSFEKLLRYLHSIDFRYSIKRDRNRAEDGISLRYRFAWNKPDIPDADLYLNGPCSVLEMMVALSIRCEEQMMSDPDIGDRTGQWFWGMIANLGLGSMTDDRFDENRARMIIDRFLDRNYEPDGRGGLFTIRNRDCDLRDVEIFYQLNWYLDNII